MAVAEQTTTLVCAWCGYNAGLDRISDHIHVVNAQVSMEHAVDRCPECKRFTASATWGRGLHFVYKVLEYRKRFRRSSWVAVYPVVCSWCNSTATEPLEINVTVANPVSQRFKYDLYSCNYCKRMTAISYLGELRNHRAERDETYHSLWYLDPNQEGL
ncbi:MAG: hypothetical protein H0X37_16175 [Herpetosiphonaceae bacterium]|nr:hypothetical protein [Herpetosiphonaceae bacterium]